MTYYLIAGERSGDLHGANLIRAIHRHDSEATFRAYGGEQMEEAGAVLVRHYRDMAFMGFLEVVKNLGTIRRIMRECQADLLAHRPDVLILIDYAGFNLRIARFAKQHGIRVFYYISPKVWAWNQRRALKIKASVDRLFTILPFETEFFAKYDYNVDYVGNPLLDALADFHPDPLFRQKAGLGGQPIIALLPGSRRQEITGILPTMLQTTRQFSDYQFVVGTVSNLPTSLYDSLLADYPNIKRVNDAAYDLLHVSVAALVTSGTATLETALLSIPQVVCYKTTTISYAIAKRLIAVPFISLVNLIAGYEVVKELIQNDLTPEQATTELKQILPGGPKRAEILAGYAAIQQKMGGPGASERAGQLMVEALT
ncbi:MULTISPECIES: lipid-A-disaccharide synthase [unclassified Spirosoma]|uniref:lipid-A-disaccharide synthase n=1 Tax=unclassified Spirosoma TaxID=2621999 RepID=UPI0009609B4C|nr:MULTISPECIES: lipid-A-disaccharide synthase [unclassified Spirosoma]MBN8823566.1 lipid-A-disaccharide synthase [Spirosoma sp.]OJW71830.1 MAG: lipid-A-disaccharide synthase [Spirosoma sp. 48-14]